MSRQTPLTQAIAMGLAFLIGCGGGGGTTEPPDTVRNLAVQAGEGQSAPAGTAVAVAPSVKVTNAAGAPVAGAAVTFSVASGGGSVAGGSKNTDANGIATVTSWTLGQTLGTNTLSATVAGGSTAKTFTATAVTGPPALLTKLAGDNQQAAVLAAVPIPPAVTLTDQFSNPVAGASVTFAVASGGGTLAGAVQTTNAAGVATVGSWTLGAAGPNTLSATLTGVPALSATFSATGQQILLTPSKDTTMAGTVAVTQFTVPAGITVTVTGTLVLNATNAVTIDGALRGNCVGVRLDAGALLTIHGTVDNSCVAADEGPNLLLIGRGGYELNGATLRSTGDLDLTTDVALIAPSAVRVVAFTSSAISRASLGQLTCGLQNTLLESKPPAARKGVDLPVRGEDGRDGRVKRVLCDGNIAFRGGVTARGQTGGDGGIGTDKAPRNTQATGGKGGAGGLLRVRASGVVSFAGTNTLKGGDGGRGGDGEAESQPVLQGLKGPNSIGTGGKGGDSGLFEIISDAEIRFFDHTDLQAGKAGTGGHGAAIGADGSPATAAIQAQEGGDAGATGGDGGSSPDKTLLASGSIVNVNLGDLSGGEGGSAGAGDARGGNGGKGSEQFPIGGNGGVANAVGGNGGAARIKKTGATTPVGRGGDGGLAIYRGTGGGDGWSACPPLNKAGGTGGNGGVLSGGDGFPGAGSPAGDFAGVFLFEAANSGNGGNGNTEGLAGQAGTATYARGGPLSALQPPNLSRRANGLRCVRANPASSQVTGFVTPTPPCSAPFPVFFNNMLFNSATTEAVSFSLSSPHSGFSFPTPSGNIPALSIVQGIQVRWNQCLFTPNTSTFIRVTFSHASGTMVQDIPITILP